MPTKPTKPCPVCKGKLVTIIHVDGKPLTVDCGRCNGTGEILDNSYGK